jgi:ATP-dependent RNA helicase DDX24/MAK5
MAAQDELSLKRKTKTTAGGAARKRTKTLRSVGDLPWKTIAHARDTTGEGDNGILELEEVENVEVVYENTDSGRMAVFRVRLVLNMIK